MVPLVKSRTTIGKEANIYIARRWKKHLALTCPMNIYANHRSLWMNPALTCRRSWKKLRWSSSTTRTHRLWRRSLRWPLQSWRLARQMCSSSLTGRSWGWPSTGPPGPWLRAARLSAGPRAHSGARGRPSPCRADRPPPPGSRAGPAECTARPPGRATRPGSGPSSPVASPPPTASTSAEGTRAWDLRDK